MTMHALLHVDDTSDAGLKVAMDAGADALLITLPLAEIRQAGQHHTLALEKLCTAQERPRLFLILDASDLTVDGATTAQIEAWLDRIMPLRPDGLYLTGTPSIHSITRLDVMLSAAEALATLPVGSTALIAEVAPCMAVSLTTEQIAAASPRLEAFSWNAIAVMKAIGAQSCTDETGQLIAPIEHVRTHTLIMAKTAGLAAIDTQNPSAGHGADLEKEIAEARRDGFTAKIASRPQDVVPISAAFAERQDTQAHQSR